MEPSPPAESMGCEEQILLPSPLVVRHTILSMGALRFFSFTGAVGILFDIPRMIEYSQLCAHLVISSGRLEVQWGVADAPCALRVVTGRRF
jgi:hypothetical protein